jgi:hypothetical protein
VRAAGRSEARPVPAGRAPGVLVLAGRAPVGLVLPGVAPVDVVLPDGMAGAATPGGGTRRAGEGAGVGALPEAGEALDETVGVPPAAGDRPTAVARRCDARTGRHVTNVPPCWVRGAQAPRSRGCRMT